MDNYNTISKNLRKILLCRKAIVVILLALLSPLMVFAQSTNPVPVQFFYVPLPENQILQALQTINTNGTASTNPVQSYISIAAIADNTVIYYDQWENGFDADISNPLNLYSITNPGGTQIWGDGNPANGAPPGIPSDIINSGTVIILNNPVQTATRQSVIDFDGGDRIAATKTVSVARMGWTTGPNTLLADALEVYDTESWGTDFRVPVGENIPNASSYRIFTYVGLSIIAGVGGATVQIDADANGSYETTVNLSEGQAHLVNGGVNVGARILSSKPVHVTLLTGDRGDQFEARWFQLLPTNFWSTAYYEPVSTPDNAQSVSGTSTVVWLYNPNTSSITVKYTTRTGTGGNTLTTNSISVSAGGYARQVIPDGYGAKFFTEDGSKFFALSATDANNSSTNLGFNRTWDWGFALVPESALTPQVLIGLGIGRDPTSGTNPNENGNPIYVTPIGNGNTAVTVYVDYDANPLTGPLTDPNGNKYDVALSLRELDRAKVYNPSGNQTGMLLYTLTTGVKLAAAWGQDPLTASAAAPGLDVGSGIPPLPLFDAGKNGTLFQDNDGDGFISPGDELIYKIVVNNISRAPVPDLLLFDNLPANTIYVPNTTFFKNSFGVTSQIPDNGTGTPFPLDGSGIILDPVSALPVRGSYEVTFRVLIKDFEDLEPGTERILNSGYASAIGTTINFSSITPLYGRIGDFVWDDINQNGIQDNGEPGIQGVTVKLYDGDGNLLTTTTTDANGYYIFLGLLPGNYQVEFVNPSQYDFTIQNADSQGLNGPKNSDANPLTGKTSTITLAGGEPNKNIDAGLRPNGSIGDRVWDDANQNGIQDNGENGIPGVIVKLYDCNDNFIAQTTTNSNGIYKFSNLRPRNYYVQFVLPSGYGFTQINQGSDDNLDSDASLTSGKTDCITLGLGEAVTNLDAGLIPSGSIGDKVWNDLDKDGIQDSNEGGIPGVTVKLYNCNDNLIATTTTDANGNYSFNNLAPGSYYVQFVAPSGYVFTQPNQGGDDDLDSDANISNGKTDCITLSLGETVTNLDAGLFANGSIGDRVWNDTNKNGIQDAGEEGLPGIVVKLYDCSDNFIAQTTTNANGNYYFLNLAPGSYYILFVLPEGYSFSPANQGTNDDIDSDANITTGKTDCFTLGLGETIVNVDAGMIEEKIADVRIEKTVSKNNPNCGENIIYTIKVTNDGPDKAKGIEVNDLLPQGLVYVSSTPSHGSYDPNTGKWIVGDLNNGSFATLAITAKVDCDQITSAFYDLGVAKDFNLFVFENLNQPSSDTQGKLAVGGNAYLANYSVGDQLPPNSGDVLIVGGTLTYISGAVYNGNVVYGVSTNLPQSSVSITGGTLRQDTPIDFAAAKAYLQNLSTTLGGYTANGTVSLQWGGLTLTGTDPYLNVFAVNGSDLSSANNVTINAPNGSVVLVNINGTNVNWSGGLSVNGTAKENVLFNFYQATNLTLLGIDVRGSILAPFAALHFPSGVVNGQVIVKSMAGSGQFNSGQFNQCKFIGYIPYEKEVTNFASITSTLTEDPNPNNNSASVKIKPVSTTSTGSNGNNNGNNNGNWQSVNGFAAGEIVYTMAYSNNAIYAGTWGGKIYKSTDNGQTWTRINNNMFVGFIWSLAVDSDNLIFAATEQGVYKFNGTSWALTSLAGIDVHSVSIGKTLSTKVLYAGTWGFGMYKSTDMGTTWTPINNGFNGYLAINSVIATSANIAYTASFGGGVYVTINGGGLWTKLNVGYDFVWSVAAIPAINPFNTKLFAGTYGDGLYRSLNGGTTWSKVTNLNAPFIYSVVVDNTGKIYVASWTTGVFSSSDNGDTWTSLGMGGLGVSAILVNPETNDVYIGTKEGKIFLSKSGSLTSVNDNDQLVPTKFELNQNYPNPFNPSTVIRFAIPEAGRFHLRVYNILGQEVATLVDGELSSGIHKVNFDASKLSSGVYIYKLTGNNVNISKKMILAK